ncbi:E3 SUMO-protein ligase KIAA1586-like [Latimeria chalumnae]|uniref:E3 SUMO-protein ligase KIAA1586-like n=1 Tax=Latimeria chalumnae TaxID=7897 RepID=UPI00313D20F3
MSAEHSESGVEYPPEKKSKSDSELTLKTKHRPQSYHKEWEADPLFSGWLQPVNGNTGKVRCRCCNIQFTAEHTVLKNHAKSNKHQEKSKCLAPTQKSIMQCTQVKPNPEKLKLETGIKTAELKLAGFLAEHNIAMRAADHLTDVLKDIFKDSNIAQNLSFGRTKATAISKNIIGSCYFEEFSEILKRKKFSILIDESTDIGTVKMLCIVMHFFDDNTKSVQTRFWKLAQIFSPQNRDAAQEGATAERLYEKMIKSFSDAGVSLANILGFSSDGCNTMMGKNNSVASRLQNEFPGILLQRCICHSLHLCASAACMQLPRRCEDLARDVYNYFKNNSKRMAQYQEFQEFCHVEPHKLLKPSQTRWLSLQQVVKHISSQWDAFLLFFYFTVAGNTAERSRKYLQVS